MSNLHESFIMAQLITTGVLDALVAEAAVGHSTVAVDGPAYHSALVLFTNHTTITKDTKLSDLTECVFSGYARGSAIVFKAPIREADGSYSVCSPSTQFQAATASPFVGQTAVGVGLIDGSTPPNLLAAGLLDEPLDFETVGNGSNIAIKLNYGGTQVESSIDVLS